MNESETAKPAAWKPLDPRQRRVLGVLIEKAKTTPAGYPMTVNAVTTACNQKNNRDPVMNLDAFDVEKTLDELRTLGAVSEVDWMGRAAKYKHHGYEWMGVSRAELAVLAELLLRGAQTLGELRARAARMEPIADLAALRPIVDGLMERGLMIALTPAGRGQLVTHNLYPEQERAELGAQSGRGAPPPPPPPADRPEPQVMASAPIPQGSTADIAELRAELAALRARIEALERKVAPPSGD